MKKQFLVFFLLSCLSSFSFAQTSIPGGNVSGTWALAGSPYNVQGSIQILDGQTLTIDPGVKVDFQGMYKLNVQGRLLAIGTSTDTIVFTAANTTNGWRGIRFDNTPTTNDTSKIKYCKLQYGKATGTSPNDNGGAFYFNNFSKAIIFNNRISNCAANFDGAGIYCYNSSPAISNNRITNNSSMGTFYGGGGIFCTNNSSPTISNNSILYNTSSSGGGIYCSGSRAIIINNTISNNSASSASSLGGGIFCSGDSLTIINNIISNNNSLRGGGIHCDGNYSIIFNNTISYNIASAGDGGGINCTAGSPTIINNIITYNSATGITGGGGGIWCTSGTSARISNNLISNNLSSSGDGGGINCYNSSPSISNNTISNNQTSFSGGGISCYNSNPGIINNTITNNTSVNGGGLYCFNSNPVSRNSILWGNTASTAGPQVFLLDEASDPNFFYCDVQGGSGAIDANGNFYTGTYQNNINSDPLFVSPSAGSGTGFNGATADWSLQNTSPCVDTGDPATLTPSTDIAGNPRVTVCRIDMGAYEYQNGTPFLLSVVQTATILCNGYSTGALQANVSGGTPPFTYLWSSGSTTSVASNLIAGDYSVTVSFAGGCTRTATITITQPPGMVVNTSQTNIDCSGNCIGSATAIVSGGTGPYTYLWSTGETTSATASNLCSGPYTVTVTATGGCTQTSTVTITTPSSLSFSAVQVNVNCYGGSNGSISISANGGANPYQYSINGGTTFQMSNYFSGLTAGTYSVIVKDNNGCQASVTVVVITEPNVLSLSTSQTTADCFTSNNGTATAIVSGGTAPYTYSWTTSPVQTTAAVSGLTPGNYTVSLIDSKGCTSTASVTIVSSITNPVICAISVDSLSKYNLIVWDKTPFAGGAADTFFIYRDTANNAYGLIGKVPYDSSSFFTDTVRTLYAANGDPNSSSWRYKIAVMDSCGNLSAKSPYHQSIFNQNNSGNFNWSQYQIEGQPLPVPALTNYLFQRDNLSNGNYSTIATLSASSVLFTDPQYATYQSTATWRVITLWSISCTATVINPKDPYVNATNLNTSRSNVYKLNNTGAVSSFSADHSISISPNPFSETATLRILDHGNSNYELRVFDLFGREVTPKIIRNSDTFVISRVGLSDGIYFLQVKTAKGTAVKKLVIKK